MAVDGLALAAVLAKAGWVVTALWAIGLSVQAAFAVISAREAWVRRAIMMAATAMAIAVVIRFGVTALELAGGWEGATGLAGLVFDMQQTSIVACLIGITVLFAGAAFGSRLLLASGAILAGLAFGLTGHARSQDIPWLATGIVGLHVVLAGFWASAPLTLWPTGSRPTTELASRNRRFGRVAILSVPVLLLAGAVLAWVIGGGVAGLTGTAYGTMIAVKVGCALGALGIGAWNRLALAGALESDAPGARARLAGAMALDAALFSAGTMAVVLATTIAAPMT